MATTSIWSVKGWLGKVMIYIENPEKTMNPETVGLCEAVSGEDSDREGLADVIAYAVREEKTRRKNSDRPPLKKKTGQPCSSMYRVSTVRLPPPAVK